MSQERSWWIAILALLVLAPSWAARGDPIPAPAPLEVSGLEVGALDLDRSAEFYAEVLGFEPVAGGRSPERVRLANGGVELTLHKVARTADLDPDRAAYVYLNVEVRDLATTTRQLGKHGLAPIAPPRETVIGRFASIRDPAGNLQQIVERKPQNPQPFAPRVFNIGIRIGSLKTARDFYCRGLGFEVMGKDHPPPIVPLKQRGAAPLILYEGSNLAAAGTTGAARSVLVLDTTDLAAALAAVRRQGLTVASEGERTALLPDPFGNQVRLRQVRACRQRSGR
jgi:catechol 2,3-dioxygenase-like lactoylglutathione lyase family enzyme